MKKHIFRSMLTLALALVLVLSLTACGDKKQKSRKSDDGREIITVWRNNFNQTALDSDQIKKVETAINARLKELGANVYIEYKDIMNSEYGDKVNLALSTNEINLFWTASWMSTIGTNDLVPNESVYDLTSLLNGTKLYNSMASSQWEATKYNGKSYFVPVYKDNVEGYDFMVRQELIDQFGWDLSKVKSLTDLEPMLADAKAAGIKYPFLTQKTAMFYRFCIDSFDFFTGDVKGNFVAVDRATNKVVCTTDSTQYKEYVTLMAKWAELGYIHEDDLNKVTTDQTTQSKDWAISWWTDIPVNDEADARYNQDVTMTPATSRWAHSTSALGSCYAVTASSNEAQAKAAIEFLGYLYTDSKLADIYTFGIEGEDFKYDENKQVTQLETGKYNHSMWESASATIVTPLSNEPANKAALYEAFNGGAKGSCAAGFRFDKTPVEAEYTACQNIFDKYGFALEHGGSSVADVDAKIAEYKQALLDAGLQKVIDEFSKQYEAWKK